MNVLIAQAKLGAQDLKLVLPYFLNRQNETLLFFVYGESVVVSVTGDFSRLNRVAGSGEVRAPMPGKVLELRIKVGEKVVERQVVCVIESMKMQLEVHAPFSGRIQEVFVEIGQVLKGPDLVATVKIEKD